MLQLYTIPHSYASLPWKNIPHVNEIISSTLIQKHSSKTKKEGSIELVPFSLTTVHKNGDIDLVSNTTRIWNKKRKN